MREKEAGLEFTPSDLARLFSSSDIKQTMIEILIDNMIDKSLDGTGLFVDDIKHSLKKLNLTFDPLMILSKFRIIQIKDNGLVELHPIVSNELNLWPHLLNILRNKYGIVVSKRMYNLGRYLKYINSLSDQLKFLLINMNLDEIVLVNAIKGLYTIRFTKDEELMDFQEALRFYKFKENLSKKAITALKAIGENMHLLTKNDIMFLKKSLLTIDKIATHADAVKQEFTRFSVSAFLSGAINFEDVLSYENMDEFITLSLLMKMNKLDQMEITAIDQNDPIMKLIQRYLQRELPKERKKAIVRIIARFFREFLIREGFIYDLNKFISSFYQKEFDLKKTLFKTIKKMQIWTPIYNQKIKASSRNLILVNDLSGSMIASYVGQIELFQGLITAIERGMESEIVFVSFSNETYAITNQSLNKINIKEQFLELLTENTMGMTNLNAIFQTLISGMPNRGERFRPPDPEQTIIFFVSDLQETIGGSLDPELVEKAIRQCRKFFVLIPKQGNFSHSNYSLILEYGAIPVFYNSVNEIPITILKVFKDELTPR
ncbi:MAG: VWA domain-containing protein [Promethearchaeota archaeon]